MKDEDLKIKAYPERRSGGQTVGVMITGIRITHLPTGLVACCACERSQVKNRKVALSMLEWGLLEVGWKDES